MIAVDELKQKILPIVMPLGVRRVAVFGSVSRGEERPDSDLDLLIDLKRAEERAPIGLRWFAVEQELSRALGREVEMVTTRSLSPFVREDVEREMVVLYDEEQSFSLSESRPSIRESPG